jgi:hypothetical protein
LLTPKSKILTLYAIFWCQNNFIFVQKVILYLDFFCLSGTVICVCEANLVPRELAILGKEREALGSQESWPRPNYALHINGNISIRFLPETDYPKDSRSFPRIARSWNEIAVKLAQVSSKFSAVKTLSGLAPLAILRFNCF